MWGGIRCKLNIQQAPLFSEARDWNEGDLEASTMLQAKPFPSMVIMPFCKRYLLYPFWQYWERRSLSARQPGSFCAQLDRQHPSSTHAFLPSCGWEYLGSDRARSQGLSQFLDRLPNDSSNNISHPPLVSRSLSTGS